MEKPSQNERLDALVDDYYRDSFERAFLLWLELNATEGLSKVIDPKFKYRRKQK